MISGKTKPNFWSRLLLSMIAIFALPNAQSLENQPAENYSSNVSVQQVLETVKVLHSEQHQQFQQPSISHSTKKQVEIQPHFIVEVLNPLAPIRAGPLLI
ncbi:secA translation cis-regulator SecM [Rodentibacter genomosp. 2]|uniref:DUF2547 domain-containing protein n=1 Tax=Rodentibacter genomosp. 2 TaxID=1908266 RepID=A0A1V3JPA9_9PAST|nr:secA translation cis-regulator SecM [Rodentibacter genomosp. 2]OOF58229.1 hypothetical protein BKK55_02895 [Rodentibacter genomosp. 2]